MSEQALAIIDECRMRLQEIGIEDVLIAVGSDTGIAFSFKGATKSVAFLAMSAWMEILMESIGNSTTDSGPINFGGE